ncbi:hypothetical protein G9464_15180 [Halostella sp. JP-L12]|uniref:hypothetical protein n=1 Tax=Halostella TaxID=1843185 RepID=UPI000EF84636|nr:MULTISPECIES: hypothetical protein [Halostella]NHN48929.1 hypothetical protein [Halostella sp. JP-L12]
MRWTSLLGGIAAVLVGFAAVAAPLYFFSVGAQGRSYASLGLVAVAVAAFVALGWADRHDTPYW